MGYAVRPTTPTILNLGCGYRTHDACVNIDWSIPLRLKRSRIGARVAPMILTGDRLRHFNSMSSRVVLHDLRRGIPYSDATVDVVYHSHLLEHLGRDDVHTFFAEVLRVLRPGGVHRVVVPDWEYLCRRYLTHLEVSDQDSGARQHHDNYIGDMIAQMVRQEAAGTSQQRTVRRLVENTMLGDARRRGEVHRWMYDRITLALLLQREGFTNINQVDHRNSSIPNWDQIGLDRAEDGSPYKPESLYMEATK